MKRQRLCLCPKSVFSHQKSSAQHGEVRSAQGLFGPLLRILREKKGTEKGEGKAQRNSVKGRNARAGRILSRLLSKDTASTLANYLNSKFKEPRAR